MSLSAGITIVSNNAGVLAAQLEPRVKAVLLTGAQTMLDEAAAHMSIYPPSGAPGGFPAKRTFTLATDVEVLDIGPLEVAAHWKAPYAAVVNYGGVHQAARPFAEPAIELAKPEIQADLADVVG